MWPSQSVSISCIIRATSSAEVADPSAFSTSPSSSPEILPSPFLSKRSKTFPTSFVSSRNKYKEYFNSSQFLIQMGDPYRRYSGSGGGRPSSSEIGHIPKATFPGYLSSEASPMTNYNTYSSFDPRAASSDFLHKDILPPRPGAYHIDGIPSVHAEPGVSGMNAGACYNGYPSSFEDPNLLGRHRDGSGISPGIGSGISPRMPDVGYDQPNSMTRTDGNPVPPVESNILFIDGLPTDSTRREIGHLFRPFIGFRELRVVHKEPRRRGDKAMVLCFVEFTDAKCAVTAMDALQGYKFDDRKPESSLLRIHFAHFPFRLPSDQDDPRVGVSR